jgi:peptide-methionine (S)-S-oxide reductase
MRRRRAQSTETAIVAGRLLLVRGGRFREGPGGARGRVGLHRRDGGEPDLPAGDGGGTGHYEAVEITYDPSVISYYAQILDLFLRSVDPTDAGGQFCDRGESYRTAIFVETPPSGGPPRRRSRAAQANWGADRDAGSGRGAFYVAEDYHQDYWKSARSS